MIYTDSCKGCENRTDVIISLAYDYAAKVSSCRRITDRLYNQQWVFPDLKSAVWNLNYYKGNRGYIIQDAIRKDIPGQLFPDVITTGQYVVCLPVEGGVN